MALDNPIGFGAGDFLELMVAAMFAPLALAWQNRIQNYAVKLAERTRWCMLFLALLPIVLRLALLPHHPVPTPNIYDEFSHLLVADTLRHFRLANPGHPLHQFFETFFVFQEPTYSSIYPIGQGLAMAIGRMIFGHPWAGVVLSVAAFCSLTYWMLRAWTTPGWALAGGLLAVFEFGPLNLWMNGYWGGAVSAAAGCLVFGALPRLLRGARKRDAAWLGFGLAIHLITRPYESTFLVVAVLLFFLQDPRALVRVIPVVVLLLLPAFAITLLQNKQITGSWTTLPYSLSQYQYGVPASLTFQADPVPHRALTPEQALDYKMQTSFRNGIDTIRTYLLRLEFRVRYYRFFFLVPLYLALPFFFLAIREYRFLWVLLCITLFALGVNFFPNFLYHYMAAVTCLLILVSITGLQQLSRLRAGSEAAGLIVFLCVVHFMFWYGLHVFDNRDFSMAVRRYETWDAINHGDPERRIAVNKQLAEISGKQLVFVRYWPQHVFQEEWVYNEADFEAARVVWARDLGTAENEKLLRYYPSRTAWLLEPDARPPALTPYPTAPPIARAETQTSGPFRQSH